MMNYYQITPDIDFTADDDSPFTSKSPSNSPTTDEDDDDPNWLILTSSKNNPSTNSKNLQKSRVDSPGLYKVDISVEGNHYKTDANHADGKDRLNFLPNNSAN